MYKKFRFIENGLAGDVYYPDPKFGVTPKSSGLYLYGLPSFIGQNEITYALVSNGALSFQPHYFGTFDSNLDFSPKNVFDTVRISQDIFDRGFAYQTGKGNQKFQLPPLEACIGHSFGNLVALRTIRHLHSVKVLILLAPTVHYRKANPNFGNKANGMSILKSIILENPFTYRLSPLEDWEEIMEGKDELPKPQDHPSLQEVIAVAGADDNYLDIPALQENLHRIVAAYCGEKVRFSLKLIPGGGHPISYLVNAGKHFDLQDVLRTYEIGSGLK